MASETGAKTVLFRAIDNDGLASSIDSFKIMVHSYAPVLTPVSDMTAGQREIVSVSFQASDTVGNRIKYYIKMAILQDGVTVPILPGLIFPIPKVGL